MPRPTSTPEETETPILTPAQTPATTETPTSTPQWYEQPMGSIAISAIAFSAVLIIAYLIRRK
jgi:hypothetical protein